MEQSLICAGMLQANTANTAIFQGPGYYFVYLRDLFTHNRPCQSDISWRCFINTRERRPVHMLADTIDESNETR